MGVGGPVLNAAFGQKLLSTSNGKWGAYASQNDNGGSMSLAHVDCVTGNQTIALGYGSQSQAQYVASDGSGKLCQVCPR